MNMRERLIDRLRHVLRTSHLGVSPALNSDTTMEELLADAVLDELHMPTREMLREMLRIAWEWGNADKDKDQAIQEWQAAIDKAREG